MRRFAIAAIACASLASTAATPISAQNAQDVISQHNNALLQQDIDAFLGTFSEDAVVIWDGDVFTGRAEIEHAYSGLFAPGAPESRVIRRGRASGGGIVQQEAYVMADGAEMCCTTRAIYVAQGQVVRIIVDSNA